MPMPSIGTAAMTPGMLRTASAWAETHGELQQAVAVAKALQGRPVKVQWTREEDIGHVNGFHPMGSRSSRPRWGLTECRRRSGSSLPANDALEGTPLIEYGPHKARLAHQLLRGFHLFPMATPNLRVEVNTMKTWVPTATWRSTGTYANVFYLESFVEEMARAAGRDPLEYRRALIAARRPRFVRGQCEADWLKALDIVAEKSGWGQGSARAPASALRSTIANPSRRAHRARRDWRNRVGEQGRDRHHRAHGHRARPGPRNHQSGSRRPADPRHDGLESWPRVQSGD